MRQPHGKMLILGALYDHRTGLGHNELRFDEDINENVLIKWIPILKRAGLIEVKKGLRGMRKIKLHTITERGIAFYQRFGKPQKVWDKFQDFDSHTEKEQLEILGEIFKIVFERSLHRFFSGEVGKLEAFRSALLNPVRDMLNKQIFQNKKEVVEKRRFYTPYSVPVFEIREIPVSFLLTDAKTAWELGHYLNQHHRDVLVNLGIETKERVEDQNNLWIEKRNGYHVTEVSLEVEERKGLIKKQYPNLLRWIESEDGREYGARYADCH